MDFLKTLLLLGAVVAWVHADAAADPDPGVVVTEHRHKHGLVRPGFVFKASKHLPGYGYKTVKGYKPPLSVTHYNTRRTYYPDVVVPTRKYVEYVPPQYDVLRPGFYVNKDYYGGGRANVLNGIHDRGYSLGDSYGYNDFEDNYDEIY